MKITKRQLRRVIEEEIATVTDDAIEDTVMDILGDEGGAAGLEPIEDALTDLEDDDVSLPDESVEDIINSVVGVKRHSDGDYIDTTQLEGRRVKVTKRQLRRIIKEERAKLYEQWKVSPADAGMADDQEIDRDMNELLSILDTAALKAKEIRGKLDDVEYAQWAGGREADDLQLALINIWHRFGLKGEDL